MRLALPLAALALDGDTPPAPGDTVDITGTARVVSIDGESATVELLTLNDAAPTPAEPDADDAPGGTAPPDGDPDDDPEFKKLMQKAKKADAGYL